MSGSPPECSAQVCAINVPAENLAGTSCADDSVLASYSTTTGATLIQCGKASEPDENRLFIYDRKNRAGTTFEFTGGRWIRSDALAAAATDGIPDRFASRPLCPAKERPTAAPGQLIFIEKRPSGTEDAPYCFRVYFVISGAGLEVRSDTGEALTRLSGDRAKQWDTLAGKLAPMLSSGKRGAGEIPNRTASVSVERASLYTHPDPAQATRMYLVKGDTVEIVDGTKAADGWYLVHYTTKSGRTMRKWIRAQDVDVIKGS